MPIVSRSSSRSRRTGVRPYGRTDRREHFDPHRILAELLALGDAGWVVSCYQKLEPGDRLGDKYRIKLKNRLRLAQERIEILGFGRAEREGIASALGTIEELFRDPASLGGGRGIAVFAAPRGLFRVVHLPYVLRSRVVVDRTAVVGELVALAETGTRLLAVVADRASARLFDVALDGVTELEGLVAPDATRPGKFHGGGIGPATTAGEYRFHTRIRAEKQRHLAGVADAAARAWRSRGCDGVVIGGIGVDADALLPFLETELRDRVIGVLRLAPKKASAAEIRERALELLADAAQTAAADAVGELVGLRESGWAVDGIEPALEALAAGQVRALLVDHDAAVPGFRFSASGRLSTTSAGSRAEGEALNVADVLDDAIEDALRQRARVHVVQGESAKRFDRLAGILRFKGPR